MSKPSLITDPEILDKIIVGFANGFSIKRCAELAGISERCLKNWIAIAKQAIKDTSLDGGKKKVSEKNAPYVSLYLQIRNARAIGQIENVNVIKQVAVGGYVARKTETMEIFVANPSGKKKGRKSSYEEGEQEVELILVEQRVKKTEEILPPNYKAAELILRATGWGVDETDDEDEVGDTNGLEDWIKQADKRSEEGWRTLNMFGNVIDGEGEEGEDDE